MNQKSYGFTLIELLIVVAIIGILAAIAVPNFLNAQVRAKISRVYADLRSLGNAIEMYALDNNTYPGGSGFWNGTKWWQKHTYRFHVLTTPIAYITSVPIDPFQTSTPQRIRADLGDIWDGGYVYDDVSRSGHTMEVYGKSYKYTVRSPGPALDWSLAHASYVNYYSVTNGLVSRGVIAWLGPGGTIF
ncbi:MAG TPA: prepilin-type N-terminal cleavage/methylation domain-containing protein [bacterium]|nr:prepilin-type N-terminal cleavage/methylation domain-containing protein [bacterium]HOL96080.1 prepilin-type N-terminal cleavage/methylation domain-containing protein [bacterium]HPP02615.1 prepilin-type N-terminal cleavage/methylation domain-containing protein [bacterium]